MTLGKQRMTEATHQTVVIGAGVAGMAAAAALAEAGVQTALVDDGYMGGLVMNVGLIEGEAHAGQSGADLVDLYLTQALGAGADYRVGAAETLELADGLWRLPEHDIAAERVVLATGAKLKTLGVPGEAELAGRGVSQCAFCDGGLYKGDDVVVVGGGDAAFQEALHLAELCGGVTICLRGEAPRARSAFQERAARRANLSIRTSVEVTEIAGADGVDAVKLSDGTKLATRAVFVFVGVAPVTDIAPVEAPRDAEGALAVDPATMATPVPGLYAVGAVRAGHGGELDHALADAALAAKAIAAG